MSPSETEIEGRRRDSNWAVLVVSYGGPEHSDEVEPFVEEVLAGKAVPVDRKREVIDHYRVCGGVSPLNQHVREILSLVTDDLHTRFGNGVSVYWGNRYGAPTLKDAISAIRESEVGTVYVWTTSAFGGSAAQRQYETAVTTALTDCVERERRDGTLRSRTTPEFQFLGRYARAKRFLQATTSVVAGVLSSQFAPRKSAEPPVLFSAHSVPEAMPGVELYVDDVRAVAEYVTGSLGLSRTYVAYQSRSGSPRQPWLGPSVFDAIDRIASTTGGTDDVVVAPIGFVVDNMEISFDLETELAAYAKDRGLTIHVAPTVGRATNFYRIVGDLIEKRRIPTTNL